jgi:hypothetical protein
MSNSKQNRLARGWLFGTALLLVMSTRASADPTTLVCDQNGAFGGYTNTGSITVDLDEAAGSVTVHFPSATSSFGQVDAHSFGPLPGKFDANSISFSIPSENITISRVTGNAVVTVTEGGMTVSQTWNCQLGKKQF